MTIRQLRTLIAVADARTFSAAADIVHVTHAAVSQQMQSLEADLGVALFDRSGRTPELTPLAHRIVRRARAVVSGYDALVPSDAGAGTLSGTLRLGAIATTLTGLAPAAVARLKSAHPALGLHIRPGLTGALLTEIERGHLDAALITKPQSLAGGLFFRELTREPMHLITSPQDCETDPMVLLRQRPYIRFNRNAVLGSLIDNWLLSRRIRVTEAMELDSAEAITSMVHTGLGVSIVPRLSVTPPAQPEVRALPLGQDAPERSLGLAAHRDHPANARAIDALFEALSGSIDAAACAEQGVLE